MILLDSNVLIWWMLGDLRLGEEAKQILKSAALVTSLITLFEIELKIKTRKLRLPGPISEFVERFDIEVYLPQADEFSRILNPKLSHTDPFDCALIGLAELKGWTAMTSDNKLLQIVAGQVKLIDSRN